MRRYEDNGRVEDFVDVLLGLEKEEKLSDPDMFYGIVVHVDDVWIKEDKILHGMVFRGTDTVATLMEWIMARMVLHPNIKAKEKAKIDAIMGNSMLVSDADIPNLHCLQSVVKESLRMHPPGPLLS
ncbi:hypothetical protein KFK09_009316 [Dendrobium nobile]|uniref:Cytochrome P450 n=1 Tax=Dendrobium nobile TaxID=94219 RepID=A0A8T3BQ22_DENNO|nr:hypothetical protein KFK09_009316 [Dendrobium nobile]